MGFIMEIIRPPGRLRNPDSALFPCVNPFIANRLVLVPPINPVPGEIAVRLSLSGLLSLAIPLSIPLSRSQPESMDLFVIYLICFGVGLLFTLVTAFTSHVWGGDGAGGDLGESGGHGAEGHAEAGFGTQDMPGFSALSPTTLASFITAFGGFGMILHGIEATSSPWISLSLSALGGFGAAAAVLWLFRWVFKKTQSSSESRVATLVGTTATVITPIGANGVGEIAYVQTGTRYSAPARGENNAAIASGVTVKITRIVGTQFYVSAL